MCGRWHLRLLRMPCTGHWVGPLGKDLFGKAIHLIKAVDVEYAHENTVASSMQTLAVKHYSEVNLISAQIPFSELIKLSCPFSPLPLWLHMCKYPMSLKWAVYHRPPTSMHMTFQIINVTLVSLMYITSLEVESYTCDCIK